MPSPPSPRTRRSYDAERHALLRHAILEGTVVTQNRVFVPAETDTLVIAAVPRYRMRRGSVIQLA
jgi:hypothetical protein